MKKSYQFDNNERAAIYKVMAERRDMRHFNGDDLPEDVLKRILAAAHLAPSVGLMQPWRFIRITQQDLKQEIFNIVEQERQITGQALAERQQEFLQLKVEGIKQCSELVVAALPDDRDKHIFGRRTLPEMDVASIACAIQNMWLAARAENIGLGWVSIFSPKALGKLLNMPKGSLPVAILCIGAVDEFYEKPMLVLENWAQEQALENFVSENSWPDSAS